MRSTGIVRKVDKLGRVVLPMELRRTMDIQEGQPMEIFTDDDGKIVLRKYEPDCLFCHSSADNLMTFNGIKFCASCLRKLLYAYNNTMNKDDVSEFVPDEEREG